MSTYEQREAELFAVEMAAPSKLPKNDRMDAEREFSDALASNPEIIAERISWLLNGSYGRGSYDAAIQVMNSRRMNRAAWLVQTIGAIELQCRPEFTRKAWKVLPKAQQEKLDELVQAEIHYYLTKCEA